MQLKRRLEEFRDDVKFAVRQMRHAPGFTAIAALTLALGIGGNSAIFALVDATLLRPLPLPQPDRLVRIWERADGSRRTAVSPLNMLDWRDRSRTFEAIGGFIPNVGSMVMAGADGNSETVPRQWVVTGFFDALGATPLAGRTFRPEDEAARTNVVVLNERFWRARFNGDRGIVGRVVRLDGDSFTVVGVVPEEAGILYQTSMWALRSIGRRPELRGAYVLGTIGRLKPGVTIEAARADMAAVAAALARDFPATNKGREVIIEPLHTALIGSDLRLTSMLFLGVVGFVLLICCANVANLLLARGTVRSRELAIRTALGARRARVVRQLVTESLVLAFIGGVLGAGVGAAILQAAPALIPEGLLPPSVAIEFDWRILAFCAAASLFVGLLFGLAPAFQATSISSARVIASDTRTSAGGGGRLRGLLVAGEIATAVLLLFGASLLLRTLIAVDSVDRGYRAEHVLTMLVDPLGSRYPTDALLTQFYRQVEEEIRAVPGVRGVAWASTLPLGVSYAGQAPFEIVGEPPLEERNRPVADYQIVSPSYFETLEVPVVAGRGFTDRDTSDSVPVCIVNEAFVRTHLQGRSPLGARVAYRPEGAPQAKPRVREIVGVARQVKGRPDETGDFLQMYVPMAQDLSDDTFLLVRPASASVRGLPASVRAAIGRVDKDQLVSVERVMTLEDIARTATSRHRFRAVLVTTFAGLALALAMVGVFGVLAYSVQQRIRELGLRRALGASGSDVFRLIAGSAARVIGTGAVVGLLLAALLSRSLSTVLFGVQPLDAMTFVVVPAVLLITATVSIAWPVWRAVHVDPAVALRIE